MNEKDKRLTIGYFNIRGKAQVPRLLCQFCNISYSNQFFTPKQFLEEKKKNPNFSLPFLSEDKSLIYGPEQMSYYILKLGNKIEMMGKTEEDQVKVKMYCWSIDSFASIIAANSMKKPSPQEMEKQWAKNLKLKLKKYEKACMAGGEWFLGYLTVIDFSIYQLVRYMDWMFPKKMKEFQNLSKIKTKISMLPEIKAYQISGESVSQISPQAILNQLTNLAPKGGKNK